MSLLKEMRSSRSQFSNPQEEALLNLVATSELLGKMGDQFLRPHGVSRSHFNILLLLRYEGADGLKQVEISRRLIITSANVSVLLDRMEARDWITREMIDRRTNLVRLSPTGRKVLDQVEPIYNQRVIQVMSGLDAPELSALTRLLEKLRGGLFALAALQKQPPTPTGPLGPGKPAGATTVHPNPAAPADPANQDDLEDLDDGNAAADAGDPETDPEDPDR